ncbi:MAG: hypothetical protein AAF386_07020, partial [Pseudomonadota bacterium]
FAANVIVEQFFVSADNDTPATHFIISTDESLSDILDLSTLGAVGTTGLHTKGLFSDGGKALDATLFGDDDDNYIQAYDGDDRIMAGAGDDRIESDGGDDRIFGQRGDDLLFGGGGDNVLIGGAGDDKIHAVGDKDLVKDWKGNDVIIARADETTIHFEGLGDYDAEDEVNTILKFDLGTDHILIDGQANDAVAAQGFLAGHAMFDGNDLFIDLGDGRAIKLIDLKDDDDPNNVEDYAEIFGF